ncbi:MAG: metallophosphoesterase [Caulobacterales bacterium]|jgi:predicted phosphodiesterase
MRRFLAMCFAFAALAAGPALAHPEHGAAKPLAPWQQASPWPDRIVVTFAGDPARTLAVNWRTDTSVPIAQAEIAKATPDARFDLAARAETARTEPISLADVKLAAKVFDIKQNADLKPVHYHSVMFDGLEPDTLYAYRVSGGEGVWSEWFQVRTAPLKGPITFLYLGDAQNGILSHWARTIRAAYAKAPDARFILHAGDLVDEASRDYEWAQWFKAVGFIHGMVPAIPVAGNHEYFRPDVSVKDSQRLLSILWRPQFRLPELAALPTELKETVYNVRYSDDLEIFVLDTQGPSLDQQAAWLDTALAASTARWKVASFHHPIFSSGRDRDNKSRREILLPVLKKHDVDLVLQGHDHTYARGAIRAQTPERTARLSDGAVGPMFVNSVSGAKQYEWSQGRWANYADEGVRLDQLGENTQFFQTIRIDAATLAYDAYTADGQLYDSFKLAKDKAGKRKLLAGNPVTMPERRFKDTAPYPGTDGLNK